MRFGFNINLKNSPDEIIQLLTNIRHRLRFIFQISMLLNKIQPFALLSCMSFISAANMFIRLVEMKLSCTMALSEEI